MKYVKTGIAVGMAAALWVLSGVNTASATVLCSEPGTGSPTGTTCPSGKAYPSGTVIHAVSIGHVKIDTIFHVVDCETSTFQGATNSEGSATETITLSLEKFTFLKCDCEVLVIKKGSAEFHWVSGTHNGETTFSGYEIAVQCQTPFGKVHCIYAGSSSNLGVATGGNPAILDMNGTLERLPTSALCGEESTITASYEITSPKPLYFTGHT